ncbi:MAG: hypothetical protein JST90_10135 [Bacteroidetes bacterium]|nr:hypothetical protein [Bacteroidota bacterium]
MGRTKSQEARIKRGVIPSRGFGISINRNKTEGTPEYANDGERYTGPFVVLDSFENITPFFHRNFLGLTPLFTQKAPRSGRTMTAGTFKTKQ